MNSEDLFRRMAELDASGAPFAHLTITGISGSGPREVGASMLVAADGSTLGTIGGGALEWPATEDALRRLRESASGTETSRLADLLDYRIVVIDSRADMVTREHLPAASGLYCAEVWSPKLCAITPSTSVAVVTHSAELDRDALRSVIGTDAGYVGLMGGRRRIAGLFGELAGEGVGREALDLVHTPIGLQIGAETPAELALCIMAEILATRSRRDRAFEEPAPARPADGTKERALHA